MPPTPDPRTGPAALGHETQGTPDPYAGGALAGREPTAVLPLVGEQPSPPRGSWWGRTLTVRAVLVTCAVALVSVLVTAIVAAPLAARSGERRAQETLAAQTNLAAEALAPRLDRGRNADEERLVQRLRERGVDAYLIRHGVVDRPGLPPQLVRRVSQGREVSGRRIVNGRPMLVQARPLPSGNGVVLAAPVNPAPWRAVLASLWLPLAAGLAAGLVAGVLLARRLARPIRTAATAAARIGAGDRTVRVPVEPPDEVADLARALNGLAAALATSEGRQREFLLSVSHELRTPLTAIRGYAEALVDGVVDAEQAPQVGVTMLAEAEHLDRLVSDLLALARLEAADFPLEPVAVDLSRLVADTAQTWQVRCATVGVRFHVEHPDHSVMAYTDPGRIRQVLDGLLGNALRVVPPDAPVVLAARPLDDGMPDAAGGPPWGGVVEVRDGGPGFTDDDLAVAFERGALHERYRGIRKVGSGLGLALAAGLVRRLGGTIAAGHAPEGGARFTVRLPPQP